MNLDDVLSALNLPTRRLIVHLLSVKPMNVKEVMSGLSNKGLKIKYRESVYKNLEKLVECGLVEKFYDEKMGICYRLVKTNFKIDLARWTIE